MSIIPMLVYDDAPAAIEFLCRAFGFEEKFRFPMPDGRIGHAELTLDGQVVLMLASVYPEMGFASPADLEGVPSQIYCRVDDVDAPTTIIVIVELRLSLTMFASIFSSS